MSEHVTLTKVVINGLKIEKIIQNLGVDFENTLNYKKAELTSGKSYLKNLGNKSESIKFKSILTPDQYVVYEKAYNSLVNLTKTKSVPIVIGNKRFMGVVESVTPSYPVEDYREYEWVITEQENFVADIKKFNTFNSSSTTAKSTNKNKTPSYITALLKCTPKKNCKKSKVKCVYHLQDMLRKDKFYLKYLRDGLFCIYTEQELKRWQTKKAKLKSKYRTGKWNKQSRDYLKKRYGIK